MRAFLVFFANFQPNDRKMEFLIVQKNFYFYFLEMKFSFGQNLF